MKPSITVYAADGTQCTYKERSVTVQDGLLYVHKDNPGKDLVVIYNRDAWSQVRVNEQA